jgi:hypothetical protein
MYKTRNYFLTSQNVSCMSARNTNFISIYSVPLTKSFFVSRTGHLLLSATLQVFCAPLSTHVRASCRLPIFHEPKPNFAKSERKRKPREKIHLTQQPRVWFVYGIFTVRISTILSEVYRGFPRSLHASIGIIP